MALKGGRKITVRGATFQWKFAHLIPRFIGDSPETGDIVVHGVTVHGRLVAFVQTKATVDEYTREHGGHQAALTPGDVQKVIEAAMDNGWDITKLSQFEYEGPLSLKDYEVTPRPKPGSVKR